jgi:trimeric autotransporter adhesin
MSTKTTFKRIALVAVAALGLGVLSVAPSSAVVSAVAVTAANGTAGAVGAASDTVTGAQISVAGLLDEGTDSITVQFVQRAAYPEGAVVVPNLIWIESTTPTLVNSTRVDNAIPFASATSYSATESVTASGGYTVTGTTSGTGTYVGAKFALFLDSAASTSRPAGTYSYTVVVKQYNRNTSTAATTTSHNVDIVVAAAADASKTPSAATSNVFLNTGATPTEDGVSVNGVATASSTPVAYLGVQIKNALGGSTAVDTVTLTVSGPGSLVVSAINTKSATVRSQAGTVNYGLVADGTAGVSTITAKLELTGQTFTKTVTFYAKNATTIAGSVRTPVLKVGDNSEAVGVTATDVNGNAWTGTAYLVASSAADALVAGSTTPTACNAWTADKGIRCNVTALTPGTVKFKLVDALLPADVKATSAEWSMTVSAATAASVKVEFDKTSYQPYEKATITVYPVDAAGNLVPANTFATLLAVGGISANQSFTGTSDTLTAVSITTATASSSTTGAVALKRVYTVYMPAQGDVTLSWTGGASLPAAGQVKGSTTVSVTNSSADAATDAANEATDAANAATDAALAAADAADAATAAAQDASDAVAALSASVSKLISSLRAQITSLTNLVIKIQKKVRA